MDHILKWTKILWHVLIIFLLPDSWIAIVRFSVSLKCIFFSNPAKILSLASSKSIASTKLFSFLEAKIAASLHKLDISAPEKPGVKLANLSAYSSKFYFGSKANGLRCILNI